MKILIPSYGRPGRQITAFELEQAGVPYTIVLTPSDPTRKKYMDEWPTITAPGTVKTLMEKRQWIVQTFGPSGKFVMIDDDLYFRARNDAGAFPRAEPRDVRELFAYVNSKLDSFAHVGLCDEFMCQHRPRGQVTRGRYNQFLAYNTKRWKKPWPRFRLLTDHDHDFNLQLQAQGLAPCILCEWTKHARPYYSEGGLSRTRTPAVERKSQNALQRFFPDLITIREDPRHRAGQRCVIRWKDALK